MGKGPSKHLQPPSKKYRTFYERRRKGIELGRVEVLEVEYDKNMVKDI